MKHVEVGPDGAHLGYVEIDGRADLPPLVYLHGLGSSSAVYFAGSAADPSLAGRRVLMLDFLGFGISDRPVSFGYSLPEHAETAARALDLLGVRGADVIGHSMGGGVAVLLAEQRPDLVGRLVLAEPSLHPSPRPRVEPYTEQSYVDGGFAAVLDEVGLTWAATMRLASPVAMYRSEHALGATMPVLDDVLLALPMPRAIIEGDQSGWLHDDPQLRAAGIDVHVVTGAGHTLMLDNPTGFAQAVARALDGVAPVPAR